MLLDESIVEETALTCSRDLSYACLGAEALSPALSQGKRERRGSG